MAPLSIGKQATSAYDRIANGLEGIAKDFGTKTAKGGKESKPSGEQLSGFVVSGTIDGETIDEVFDTKGEALRYVQSQLRDAESYSIDIMRGDKVLERFEKGVVAEEALEADVASKGISKEDDSVPEEGVEAGLSNETAEIGEEDEEPAVDSRLPAQSKRAKARIVRKKQKTT